MKVTTLGLLAVGLCLASGMAACGSSGDEAQSTDNTPPPAGDDGTNGAETGAPPAAGATYPASHPAFPQVQDLGGPVLPTPKVVPIFFPGFDFKTEIVDFASKVGATAYWKAISDEYGVGALTAATAIDVADPAPMAIKDADIKAWLVSRFDGTHPEFGTKPIAGAIYTFYYPTSTTITLGGGFGGDGGVDGGSHHGGGGSCKSFGGYHDSVSVGGMNVAYAVIPECAEFGGLTGVDVVTGTASHEWIEAATDPYPTDNPAYAQPDDDHIAWQFVLGGGEVGDMCAQDMDAFFKPSELGYTVQRSWSNAAAAAAKNPCVPASDKPYFNAAPVQADDIALGGGTTKGIKVPVGQSKTIELDLFSTAPTSGPWSVAVQALSGFGSSSATPPVSFTLDKSSGKNGDKLKLTIKANAAATSRLGATTFLVESKLGGDIRLWAGLVGN